MLYQSGTQRIEIIVKKDSGSGNFGAKETSTENIGGGAGEEKREGWRAILTGSTNKARQNRVIKTNTTHAIAVGKQIMDLGIEYYIGGIGIQHGDQALQDQVSRSMEIVKDMTGFASSVAMGAVYGAWGGPIGAVLGAAFGAASSAVSIGAKYSARKRDYDFKMFKENNSIEYKRARASINLTTGRLR